MMFPGRYKGRLWEQALVPFVRFSQVESSGGLLLVASAVVALLWANSPWAGSYVALWATPVTLQIGGTSLALSLGHWINDGLMVVFFFMVGLEIKREILVGELNSLRQALLPVVAAVGGMAVPALLFLFLTRGTPGQVGWGIPMATDIAFALGILSLLGSRVPTGLKVFLAAVAIVDDIGAVLMIALFYSGDISFFWLGTAGGIFCFMLLLNVVGARHPVFYALCGVALWLAFLGSGVHATVAGVLAAMAIPARPRIPSGDFLARARNHLERFAASPQDDIRVDREKQAAIDGMRKVGLLATTPLQRIEQALHPYVAYGVMPLFALANAGVRLSGPAGAFVDPVSLGVLLGLVVGKQIGVFLASFTMFRLGLSALPAGTRLIHFYGVSCLAGIGFTMSIFMAALAFAGQPVFETEAKVAILAASTVAGLLGYTILRLTPPSR